MIQLTISIFLCSPFTMINKSSHEWNTDDAERIVSSSITCKRRYNSCLKTFIKTDKKAYNAICK